MQSFMQKLKILRFRTKNALFREFWTGIRKSYCHMGNQRPRISLRETFGAKRKSLNLGSKMADLGILRLDVEKNIVIFEISTFQFF